MKKAVVFLSILISCLQVTTAQKNDVSPGFRRMTKNEITYFNNLHDSLYLAIPHEYKDWTANGDSRAFDAAKHWCEDPVDGTDCTGIFPNNIGTTDPYSLSINQDFAMSNQESGNLMVAAMGALKDYNDPVQIATALKSTAKSKITISITNNLSIDDVESTSTNLGISYCPKTPPVMIELPIPAALAVKGIRSVACPILGEGKQPDMHANYYDNAFIVLGKTTIRKVEKKYDDGLMANDYDISFDNKKISKLINQNIVIKITGDSDDIDAIINLIDWKMLNSMLAQ